MRFLLVAAEWLLILAQKFLENYIYFFNSYGMMKYTTIINNKLMNY